MSTYNFCMHIDIMHMIYHLKTNLSFSWLSPLSDKFRTTKRALLKYCNVGVVKFKWSQSCLCHVFEKHSHSLSQCLCLYNCCAHYNQWMMRILFFFTQQTYFFTDQSDTPVVCRDLKIRSLKPFWWNKLYNSVHIAVPNDEFVILLKQEVKSANVDKRLKTYCAFSGVTFFCLLEFHILMYLHSSKYYHQKTI